MAFPKFQSFRAINRLANFFTFGLFNTGMDTSWVDGNAGGGGSAPIFNDFTSQCNGVTVTFTLSSAPSVPDNVVLYWNGVSMRRTDGFSITGATITTSFVPAGGDLLWAYHYA